MTRNSNPRYIWTPSIGEEVAVYLMVVGVVFAAFWAMPQAARSGGLRPEPISVVSAVPAPAAIAESAR